MRYDPQALRAILYTALPAGFVVPEHTENEHFYRVMDPKKGNPKYPSVTGKLQILKDEGLINFKMNRVIQYVFEHHKEFTEANIMEHIARAEAEPTRIFQEAGDIGTEIHDYREVIFKQWISTGKRPENFPSFIPQEKYDIRAESALAALETFCIEHLYVPIATELKVFSHELKVGGTLDDLGLALFPKRAGKDPACDHVSTALNGEQESCIVAKQDSNVDTCLKCEAKWQWEFVLMDVKTSNRFKDHYFFQVALYYGMLRKLTGLKVDRSFILKLSKEDRRFQIEDLKRPAKIMQFAKAVMRTNEGIEFIKSLRKDNQKNVARVSLDDI